MRRILLVDDYPLGRKLAARKLRDAGFEVITANSGEEALAAAGRERPDAIISDIRMTGMSGFELTEAIRADPRTATTPVILLSSAIEAHERERGSALAVPCVVRTSDLRELVERLEEVLRPC